jgi:glycosyltransferase involved in cell wall biosynthesis
MPSLQQYECLIFSNETLEALRFADKRSKKIFLAHSLPRYFFDQKEAYEAKVPWYARGIYRWIRSWMYARFCRHIHAVDQIWTPSPALAQFLQEHFHLSAIVLPPPVDLSFFRPSTGGSKKYFLSAAKLTHNKRVDSIIRVFRQLPQWKLHILHGPNDPDLQLCKNLALGYEHITFEVLENQQDLPLRYSEAFATIFIPQREEF